MWSKLLWFFKKRFNFFFLQRILSSLFTLSVFICCPVQMDRTVCLGSQNCQLLSTESLGRSTKLCAIISVTEHLSFRESHMTHLFWACVCISGMKSRERVLASLLAESGFSMNLKVTVSAFQEIAFSWCSKHIVSKIFCQSTSEKVYGSGWDL